MVDANYIYTFGAYATLIGVGYVIYQVSTAKARKRAATTISKQANVADAEPRKEDRKKKQRKENYAHVAQEAASKAVDTKPAEKESTPFLSNVDNSKDDEASNREFAKQLAKAKEGHKFSKNTETSKKQREKSVKQSRANQLTPPGAEKPAAPSASSSNGADADDDQSPVRSPEASAVDASGVADMLEPTPSGPSVLRLTETATKEKKKKPAKAPEVVETKKQRQNRKKAEAAKAAREDAEKERKVLEEQQRRQARVSEGRAAKDGSQFTNAAVKNSAWDQGTPNGGKQDDAAGFQPLLDTSDKPTQVKSQTQPKPVASLKQQESSWVSTIPSEEEQMEMLKEDADEWSTVKTKSKKSNKKTQPASDSDNEPQRTVSKPAGQSTAAPAAPTLSRAPPSNKSFGSFSALTANNEPEEEEEEEWDV
ncbi:hypothetical protein N3K66_001440 [Trichothecium roseum]|uniref:Uncharacterized protein n=1 Tax=Trichothecium roseum TaxID=47278 RepID=A0ACC0VG90_9HYPO|nr:hypothetical protein N3K66_001440 [Trichothecium roseum]